MNEIEEHLFLLSRDYYRYNLVDKYPVLEMAKSLLKLEKYNLDDEDYYSFDKTLYDIKNILREININYFKQIIRMITEDDTNKPIIYTYNSNNYIRNNSFITGNEIHFYKTDTKFDKYYLLHEFSHYLINKSKFFNLNRPKNEIPPILMEFIISNIFDEKNAIKNRINNTVFESKSLIIKQSIIDGNLDLEGLFELYDLTEEEKKFIKKDILSKNYLNYKDEKKYIYGTLYGYYYSLNNDIDNYKNIVETMNNCEFRLPLVDTESLIYKLKKDYLI